MLLELADYSHLILRVAAMAGASPGGADEEQLMISTRLQTDR